MSDRNGHPPAHLEAPAPDYLASCLELPFFEPAHAELARQAHAWAKQALPGVAGAAADLDSHCVGLVQALGKAGLLRYCVPRAWGGALEELDSRSITCCAFSVATIFAMAGSRVTRRPPWPWTSRSQAAR